VAASNIRKYDDSFIPLQDNVALAAKSVAQGSGLVHSFIHWHWAHIGNFMFIFLTLAFSVLWDQVRTSSSHTNPERVSAGWCIDSMTRKKPDSTTR
jgi:hypothetical protein